MTVILPVENSELPRFGPRNLSHRPHGRNV
jgi:hypothetical protein